MISKNGYIKALYYKSGTGVDSHIIESRCTFLQTFTSKLTPSIP